MRGIYKNITEERGILRKLRVRGKEIKWEERGGKEKGDQNMKRGRVNINIINFRNYLKNVCVLTC